MNKDTLTFWHGWIKAELDKCAAFWLENGIDRVHGGVYTCLDRKGEIYSTDKSVWMQGRCGWIYAYLCHVYGVRDEWLAASESCLDFLENHCVNHAAGGVVLLHGAADRLVSGQVHAEAALHPQKGFDYAVDVVNVRVKQLRRAVDEGALHGDLAV